MTKFNPRAELQITICQGIDLHDTQMIGKQDPQVRVQCLGETWSTEPCVDGSKNPKWTRKNTHRFILHTEAQVTSELLQVRITSGSSEIGTMAMPVSRFADGRWVNDVFPVQHGGEQKGSLRIIGILCRPLVEAPLPPAEGAMYNVPKAPFVRPPAKLEDKEGFLVKRGQMFKNWKRRWFRLRGTLLYYSENKTSDPKGSVDLKGATIGPSKTVKADRGGVHVIEIKTLKDRTLYVYSPSLGDAKSWTAAFQIASGKYPEARRLSRPDIDLAATGAALAAAAIGGAGGEKVAAVVQGSPVAPATPAAPAPAAPAAPAAPGAYPTAPAAPAPVAPAPAAPAAPTAPGAYPTAPSPAGPAAASTAAPAAPAHGTIDYAPPDLPGAGSPHPSTLPGSGGMGYPPASTAPASSPYGAAPYPPAGPVAPTPAAPRAPGPAYGSTAAPASAPYGAAPASAPYGAAPASAPYGASAASAPYGAAPTSAPYGAAPAPATAPYGASSGYSAPSGAVTTSYGGGAPAPGAYPSAAGAPAPGAYPAGAYPAGGMAADMARMQQQQMAMAGAMAGQMAAMTGAMAATMGSAARPYGAGPAYGYSAGGAPGAYPAASAPGAYPAGAYPAGTGYSAGGAPAPTPGVAPGTARGLGNMMRGRGGLF